MLETAEHKIILEFQSSVELLCLSMSICHNYFLLNSLLPKIRFWNSELKLLSPKMSLVVAVAVYKNSVFLRKEALQH